MNFKDLSLEEIIKLIKSWKTTSKEVFDYFLARIEKYDDKLKCFNYINKDGLKDSPESVLAWVPIWIKDLFCEKGIPTTASSGMLENFVPPYDSTLIKHLNKAWMSSIGKCNMDDSAMGTSGENSNVANTINPWWTNRIPGWSSSWSVASVAAWLVPATLWTDTGWSIRQPASMCNVVWFKPTYGRNSRYGVIPMASSLDSPWTVTKTVKDAGLLYEIMNWEDPLENTTIAWKDIIDPKIWESKDLKWVKVWIPKEYFEEWLEDNVRKTVEEAIEKFKELWAEIVDVSLPMTKYAIAAYYIIVPAEVSTNIARLDGIRFGHNSKEIPKDLHDLYLNNRWEWLWEEVQRRSIVGSYVLSAWFYDAYYIKAAKVRTKIIEEFKNIFKEVDVLLTPPTPSAAWKIWEKANDPLKLYLADAYTIPSAIAWLPTMSIPAGFVESNDEDKEKLPVWVQLIWPMFNEQRLLEVGHVYEQATQFWKINPEGFED